MYKALFQGIDAVDVILATLTPAVVIVAIWTLFVVDTASKMG